MAEYLISNLDIKLFYDKYKDEYLHRRGNASPSVWDESYKWDILPKLTKDLAVFNSVTKDNIKEIFAVYKKYNPNEGTFIDWREIDDLNTLMQKPNGWQLIKDLWTATPETVASIIDTNNLSMPILGMNGKSFSPRTFGFLLAGYKPGYFPIYLDSKYKFLKESLNRLDDWKSASRGHKYQIFTQATLMLGELIKQDAASNVVNGITVNCDYTALDGQDFIYVTEHIVKGTGYTKPSESV